MLPDIERPLREEQHRALTMAAEWSESSPYLHEDSGERSEDRL